MGQPENSAHQFLDSCCLISPPNLDGFGCAIYEINGLEMHFKIMHRKQKSIKIWLRYRGKQFHTFRIFRVSETNSHFTITEQYCHFAHHMSDVHKAVLLSNVRGF